MTTFSAPDACTLPSAAQPLRVAEFADLFGSRRALVSRERPTVLRIELEAEPGLAAAVEDLTRRETRCCSFFDFAVREVGGAVTLRVGVPETEVEVLDGLQALAEAGPGDAQR
ncbi:hypothetical protein CLV56_0793 [Mumia flava]|uniref:Arsenate reductase n=1 Tax=Mumia flava TaxID=1348852 RepID=A0A0B2BJM6_9ACTN|nr:hypothetical protein [Mumia flava]PJJ56584.1 hypothetical protein CLV56_0793 [Mumia flava]